MKPPIPRKNEKLTSTELENIARFDSHLIDQMAEWANKQLSCVHCKRCNTRCEVLSEPDLDIGLVEEGYQSLMAVPSAKRPAAVLLLVDERPELYRALRRCCFCGHCTAPCQTHMLASERMREWRELFMQAGLMPPDDSRLVMVDNEWHIFSAYRAIYGIAYPEFLSLADASTQGPGMADTLFFPGCSLVSYTPELIRVVGEWLNRAGIKWALSDDCCGSPLFSAGLHDRAEALQQRILEQMQAAGITRMVTVCPGCGDEFISAMGDKIDVVPLPELMYKQARSAEKQGDTSLSFNPVDTKSLTFFDSCHDRYDNRHGNAIRKLMKTYIPHAEQREMYHSRSGTLCCGAGGAVASYDPDITQRRVWRIIKEAQETGAETLVTACPTCTYTVAQACLGQEEVCGINNAHYLELLFGIPVDWKLIFGQLESMWSGEYGPWLNETFFY